MPTALFSPSVRLHGLMSQWKTLPRDKQGENTNKYIHPDASGQGGDGTSSPRCPPVGDVPPHSKRSPSLKCATIYPHSKGIEERGGGE